jgi:hypothetical protein
MAVMSSLTLRQQLAVLSEALGGRMAIDGTWRARPAGHRPRVTAAPIAVLATAMATRPSHHYAARGKSRAPDTAAGSAVLARPALPN